MAILQEYSPMTYHSERPGLLKALDMLCRLMENVLMFVAGYMVFSAMIITFVDVIMRYIFNSPLNWVFDFITMYLLPGSYFLAFSYALRTGNHLKVDYFRNRFPHKFSNLCIAFFGFVAVAIFIYITYTYALRTYTAWKEGEIIYGAVNWLVWPSDLIISVSSFVFSFRLTIKIIDQYVLKGSEL